MSNKQTNPAGLILLALVAWFVLRASAPVPSPDPETPLSQYVERLALATVDGATRDQEAGRLAEVYAGIAAEIQTLIDPLADSDLKRPQDAIARANRDSAETLGPRAAAWSTFWKRLADRLEQENVEPSIYAVGDVYAEVAAGLRAVGGARGQPNASPVPAGERTTSETGPASDYDPEAAYTNGDAVGCFLDDDSSSAAIRKAARAGEAQFDAAGGRCFGTAFPRSFAGEGRGRRAVYFNYALRFDNDPLPVYQIKQITGNCVEASNGDVTFTHMLGVAIFLHKRPLQFEGPGSVVFYSRRGHCGQGMHLGTAAAAHLADGVAWRKIYCGGKYDLRDSYADQKLARDHCRNPKSTLADLWEETRKTPVGQVARFTGTMDDALDLLFAGGALHTGSRSTAAKDGDPISSVIRIGSHAQTCVGYDDTPEFRDWYQNTTGRRITEPVLFFVQTWGDVSYVKKHWPAHLWGTPPQGVFVLAWKDARRLIEATCYAYWPDLSGVTPASLDWSLRNATTRHVGRTCDRDLQLAIGG